MPRSLFERSSSPRSRPWGDRGQGTFSLRTFAVALLALPTTIGELRWTRSRPSKLCCLRLPPHPSLMQSRLCSLMVRHHLLPLRRRNPLLLGMTCDPLFPQIVRRAQRQREKGVRTELAHPSPLFVGSLFDSVLITDSAFCLRVLGARLCTRPELILGTFRCST